MSHAESPRCRARHRKRWVATVTAASSGAPRLLRWPWGNRNAASDMRNRGRVHWKGDSVSPHPRCRMGTCGTAPEPAESVFKIRFGEPLATPCLPMPSTVTRGLRTGTLSPTRATATDQQIACTDLPSEAQAPAGAATGGEPPSARTFFRADRAVHHRERNRMMARTKPIRRSYGAGEWGRNRVRVFPDPKTGLFQIEWRENGRRLTRSLKHRGWRRAKRQADEFAAGYLGPEPGTGLSRSRAAHPGAAF